MDPDPLDVPLSAGGGQKSAPARFGNGGWRAPDDGPREAHVPGWPDFAPDCPGRGFWILLLGGALVSAIGLAWVIMAVLR